MMPGIVTVAAVVGGAVSAYFLWPTAAVPEAAAAVAFPSPAPVAGVDEDGRNTLERKRERTRTQWNTRCFGAAQPAQLFLDSIADIKG
jgi:hypothetical protein